MAKSHGIDAARLSKSTRWLDGGCNEQRVLQPGRRWHVVSTPGNMHRVLFTWMLRPLANLSLRSRRNQPGDLPRLEGITVK